MGLPSHSPLSFKFYVKNNLHNRRWKSYHHGVQNSITRIHSTYLDESIVPHLIKCEHPQILGTHPAPVGRLSLHSLYQTTRSSGRDGEGTPGRDLSCGRSQGKRLVCGRTWKAREAKVQERGWEHGLGERSAGPDHIHLFLFLKKTFQSLKCYFLIFIFFPIFENLQNLFPFNHFNVATRNFQITYVACVISLLGGTGLELSSAPGT